jgi:hypothetical protein
MAAGIQADSFFLNCKLVLIRTALCQGAKKHAGDENRAIRSQVAGKFFFHFKLMPCRRAFWLTERNLLWRERSRNPGKRKSLKSNESKLGFRTFS